MSSLVIGDLLYAVGIDQGSVAGLNAQLAALARQKPVTINATINASGAQTAASGFKAAQAAADPLRETIKRLQNEVAGLRNQYIAVGGSAKDFAEANDKVKAAALSAAAGLDKQSKEYRDLTLVAAQAERGTTTALGGISRLGLASQVSAGILKSGIISQLSSMTGLAGPAAMSLSAVASGGLTPMATAAGLAGAGLLGLAAGLKGAVDIAASFEDAMGGIKAITNATGQELEQLRSLALRMGADTSFSAKEAAAGIEELAAAGVSTNDILAGGLAGTLALAAATGIKDLGFAANVAAGSMNAFGLSAADLATVADTIANAANVSALKIEDFGQAVASGGSSAKAAGLDVNTFAAAISLMADNMIRGSDAGTSLKAFLAALTPNSKAAKDEMEKLGFSAFDAAGKMKTLPEIVSGLEKAFAGMTEKQRATTAELIFGSDGIRTFNTLLAAGTDGLNSRVTALGKQGAAEEAAKARLDTYRGAQEAFKGSIETLAITLGTIFLPALTEITKGATSVINFLTNLGAAFKTTGGSVESIAGNLPGISAAIEAVRPAIGALGGAFSSAFTLIKTVYDTLLKPTIDALKPLLDGGLSGALTLAKTGLNTLTGLFDALTKLLKGDLKGAFTTLASTIDGAASGTKEAAEEVWRGIKGAFRTVTTFFIQIGKDLVAGLVQGLKDAAQSAYDTVKGFGQSIIDTISGVFQRKSPSRVFMAIGKDLVLGLAIGVSSNSGLALEQVRAMGHAMIGVFKALSKGDVYDAISGLVGAVGEVFKNGAPGVNDAVTSFTGGIKGALEKLSKGDWFGAVLAGLGGLLDSIVDLFTGAAESLRDAVKSLSDLQKSFQIVDASFFGHLEERSRGWFADLFGGPETVAVINEAAVNVGRALESGVRGGFQNGLKAFMDGTGSLIDGLRQGIRDAIINAIIEAVIQGAIIKGALGKLLGALADAFASGDFTLAAGIIKQIGAALPGLVSGLETMLKPLKDVIDQALPKAGGEAGGGVVAPTGLTLSAPPSVQLAMAAPLMNAVSDAGAHVTRFGGIVDAFGGYVTSLVTQGIRVTVDAGGTTYSGAGTAALR